MTKKSKSRSKVTSSTAVSDSNASKSSHAQVNSKSEAFTASATVGKGNSNAIGSTFITESKYSGTSVSTTSSLAGIPGIVDDFLAPKFVKVLSLSDHGFEKTPPPALSEFRAATTLTDGNANKVSQKKKDGPDENSTPPGAKKNKRKKNKPIKHTSLSTLNALYESEDGRELDDLSVNGNGSSEFCDNINSILSTKEVTSLAKHQRIRSSALRHYEGNNIVLVSNEDDDNAQYPTTSCYDDQNFVYDDEEELRGEVEPPTSKPPRSCAASNNLLLDQDDDDDEGRRQGSWSLPGAQYKVNNCIPTTSKIPASSSVAFSESENVKGLSSAACGGGVTTFVPGASSFYPALVTCHSIWDGVNNPCEIKDCSKLATKKCSQCKSVFYCGEDHQRSDWKKHKNECIPYRMETRFGDDVSVAVASRNIPAGQKIFSDKPLLVLPVADTENDFINVMDVPCIRKRLSCSTDPLVENSDANEEPIVCTAKRPACFGCLRSVEFIGPPRYNCNRCQLPLCSYKCHLDTIHQATECQAISSSGERRLDQYFCYHTMYLDIEIVRALQMEALDSSQWERFMQMKQNLRVESYKNSHRYLKFIENYRELVPISAKLSGYNDDLIGNVHAIITALSFRPSLKSSFKLLFSTQILFGHDCIPNTFHYLEDSPNGKVSGMTLVTKAAVPICKREIITIDFSPTPFLYYPLRRMILRNVLSIDNCVCKRCTSPTLIDDHTGDIRCPRCHHGVICPEKAIKWSNSVWACTTCLEEFSYQTVFSITKECRHELASILGQPRHLVVPLLVQFINRRENDLHPGHSIILQAWSFIEAHLRATLSATRLATPGPRYPENTIDEYRLLGKCSEEIDNHLKIVRPGICFERGCLLINRYHMMLAVSAKRFNIRLIRRKEYIQDLMQCIKILQEALKIFQMYEGFNRDVALHIQETTSALVTTKSFIQNQIITDNEETKQRKAAGLANAAASLMGPAFT